MSFTEMKCSSKALKLKNKIIGWPTQSLQLGGKEKMIKRRFKFLANAPLVGHRICFAFTVSTRHGKQFTWTFQAFSLLVYSTSSSWLNHSAAQEQQCQFRHAPALAAAEVWGASLPVASTSSALREAGLTGAGPSLCDSTTGQLLLPPSPSPFGGQVTSTDLRKAKHKRFVLRWLWASKQPSLSSTSGTEVHVALALLCSTGTEMTHTFLPEKK